MLQIGKYIVDNLQQHARVHCGFASVADVRNLALEDQMDSFVLAETFKSVAHNTRALRRTLATSWCCCCCCCSSSFFSLSVLS